MKRRDFIKVTAKGGVLGLDSNELSIVVNYEDFNKNKYSIKREFTVSLKNVTILQKIQIYLNKLIRWVMG